MPIPGFDPIPLTVENTAYVGNDGSVGGYPTDPWVSYDVNGSVVLFPTTDDFGGPWNSSSPADNWMVWPGSWRNMVVTTGIWHEDDDAVGVVARHNLVDSYYLFIGTRNTLPAVTDGSLLIPGTQWRLYRVDSSGALELGQIGCGGVNPCIPNSGATGQGGVFGMSVVDNRVTGFIWVPGQGFVQLLNVYDPNPLPPGAAGVWAYNSGESLFQTGFSQIQVYLWDRDEDGSADDLDCSPNEPTIYPDAFDVCGDGIDQDCSGADMSCSPSDDDGDGFSEIEGDCNDDDRSVSPVAVEICEDGIDQDCNGIDASCNPVDEDGDGFDTSADCDDTNPGIFPGAGEVCGDGIDNDCSGRDNPCQPNDSDGDGYSTDGGDCNDADNQVYPGAPEQCDGLVDHDCDTHIDESCLVPWHNDGLVDQLFLSGCGCDHDLKRGLGAWVFLLLVPLAIRRRV